MQRCVQQTHVERQYSVFSPRSDNHTVELGVERAGDPMDKDILIMFGNDRGNHWYSVILDKRPGRCEIVYYDSGAGSSSTRTTVEERCLFTLRFVNDFRAYVIKTFKFSWGPASLSASTFQIRDGMSVRQSNAFDCGVFSLFNVERYLSQRDHRVFGQNTMPLIRAKIIIDLYAFGNSTDLIDDF